MDIPMDSIINNNSPQFLGLVHCLHILSSLIKVSNKQANKLNACLLCFC